MGGGGGRTRERVVVQIWGGCKTKEEEGVSGSGEAFVCVGLVASLVLVGLFMARGRIYLWESVSFVSVRHSPWPPLPTLSASTCH
jgi:hypothetical protein